MAPTRTELLRETDRRLRRTYLHVGEELNRVRLDANVSVSALSRATGVDDAYIGRIEAGTARPSVEVLIALGLALGADLNIRLFAGAGPRLHDRFQAPMLEALLGSLSARWRVELEVPILRPARGVIDAVLRDRRSDLIVATEIQSDLRRLEQQLRWAHEKAEALGAAGTVSQLLVLRSTTRTRELARRYEQTLRTAFPARTAEAVASLASVDLPWPGNAIVWVHLHGPKVAVMRHPPPGVAVGR